MTRTQVEKTVRLWQTRLKLEHWDISVDWTKAPREDAYATTWRLNQYDRAEMCFDPAHKNWDADFATKTIVHELLHLTTRDLDRSVSDAEPSMHPEAYRALEKRYDHEIEGVVDRLATILVELA